MMRLFGKNGPTNKLFLGVGFFTKTLNCEIFEAVHAIFQVWLGWVGLIADPPRIVRKRAPSTRSHLTFTHPRAPSTAPPCSLGGRVA